MAGLPEHVSRLLNDESVSFLRRASSRYLGRIFDVEISDAFDCTVEAGGRTIEADARMACAKAADGFPYMMQLVGFRVWAQNPRPDAITLKDAQREIVLANARWNARFLAPPEVPFPLETVRSWR